MVRENFREHIKGLENQVTNMGKLVAVAITRAVEALKTRNSTEAKKIIDEDAIINKKRWDIEEECIDLIALQQPVATDLREIIAVLNIITELERIGDYAEGIAKIVLMMGDEPLIKPLVNIPTMAEKATEMLKQSLEAFINRDASTAAEICKKDDEVDSLYEKVYHEMLSYMIKDPSTISRATYLIWTAHNLERIADRVTNICERTAFLVTGTIQEINASKY